MITLTLRTSVSQKRPLRKQKLKPQMRRVGDVCKNDTSQRVIIQNIWRSPTNHYQKHNWLDRKDKGHAKNLYRREIPNGRHMEKCTTFLITKEVEIKMIRG